MAAAKSDKSPYDESPWNCGLCLDHLKSPKLLPCSHTYCEECLKDLVKHHPSGYFPCPNCRESVKVPRGGVTAFKNNFYLESLKDNKMPMCKQKHEKSREIELFCQQCEVCICLECKIKDHSNHPTEDVRTTAKVIKAKLNRDQMGLSGVISDFKKHLDKFLKEQQAVKIKRAVVKRDIINRHRLMVAEADRCRDEALFSLDTVTASINSELDTIIKDMQKNFGELTKLHKRMEMCVESEDGGALLITAQDIYTDALKQEKVVLGLKEKKIEKISRPVLHSSVSAGFTFKTEEQFIGRVERMDAAVTGPDFAVKKLFQCTKETDISSEIFSLCPREDGTVCVTYEHNGGSTSRHPEVYNLKGQVLLTVKSAQGRTTLMYNTTEGINVLSSQSQEHFSTFAKSRRLFKLKNLLNGKADVFSVTANSGKPGKISESVVCQISCARHRAFDVCDSGIVYAVVEEGLHSADSAVRKVHIYSDKYEKPVATYQPPNLPFFPSDVCFYLLAGRSVLLVADEVTDTIHVVGEENGELQFLCFLAVGSPLLIQPTALNTDVSDRLWVGCKNGSVLLCEPAFQDD